MDSVLNHYFKSISLFQSGENAKIQAKHKVNMNNMLPICYLNKDD